MKHPIPSGGVVKHTEGTYTQVFDKDGTVVATSFVAGDSEYLNEHEETLDEQDPRLNFYAEFGTCEGYEDGKEMLEA